jgi:hypothetical protein
MTKKFALFLAAFCLVSVMPMPVSAQSFRLKANIPFAFMVGGKSMPAGEYAVDRRLTDRPAGPLSFTNEAGGGGFALPVLIGGGATVTHNQPELIFHHYGDRYFLYQVWDGYSPAGFQMQPSRDERKAAKENAAIQPENAVILAMR